MSFKLSKETDSHYIVTHPHGSFMKIAKKGLSDKMHQQIKSFASGGKVKEFGPGGIDEPDDDDESENPIKFPVAKDEEVNNPKLQQANLAEGGKVDPAQDSDSWADAGYKFFTNQNPGAGPTNSQMPGSYLFQALGGNSQSPQPEGPNSPPSQELASAVPNSTVPNSSPQEVPQPAVMPQENQIAAQSQQKVPAGMNPADFVKPFKDIEGQIKQGSRDYAAAENTAGIAGGKAQQEGIDSLAKVQQDEQAHQAWMHQHLEQVANELNSGQIDFNRVWHNADTGQKLTAGIGMLISGLGSGLVNQPNMAHQIINETIDRDIKSQIADQEKKKTAFGMYKDIFQNDMQAEGAARITGQAIVAAKMNQIAQNARGPLAAAEMKLKNAPTLMQLQSNIANWSYNGAKLNLMKKPAGTPTTQTNTQNVSSATNPQSEPQSGPEASLASTMPPSAKNVSKEGPYKVDMGQTRQLNDDRIAELRANNMITPELQKTLDTYEEAQTAKTNVKKYMDEMNEQIDKHKGSVGALKAYRALSDIHYEGLSLPKMTGVFGEGARRYNDAFDKAKDSLTRFFGKRMTPELLGDVGGMLQSPMETKPERMDKYEVLKKIDEQSAWRTLDQMGLLK